MAIYRVIDIETTGMEPPAAIIEIGYADLTHIDGLTEIAAPRAKLFGSADGCPPEVVAVHHILPEQIEGLPLCDQATLAKLARNGCDAVVAHNAEFETKWFTPDILGPTPLICTYKAALRVWPDAPGHSNQVLRYWLKHTLADDLAMPPHRAGPDAYVTAHILQSLMQLASIEDMIAWTKEPRLLPTCPIGKFRGKAWPDVEVGFLRWMLDQASMEADLKWNARRELERRAA